MHDLFLAIFAELTQPLSTVKPTHFNIIFYLDGVVLELLSPVPRAFRDDAPRIINQPGARQLGLNFILCCTIKHGGNGAETEPIRRPAGVNFQHLPDVHASWHAERVQDDFNASPVL